MSKLKKLLDHIMVVPAIINLVKSLVKIFETEGNGPTKKEAVLESVKLAYLEIQKRANLKVSLNFVLNVADPAIDIIVSFYNLIGVFKHKEQIN